ncbi:hypothetical protein ACFL3V_00990 [Nanoarchaeota archaeon]
MKAQRFDFRLVLLFVLFTLLLASPFMYRAWQIQEVYIYPNVREVVLDSVFLLREEYGLTIGDLTINDIVLDGADLYTTIHEEYHGFVDRDMYDDLEQDYVVKYSFDDDTFSVEDIIR